MYSITIIFVIFLSGCLAAPMDSPVRIDLPVYDEPYKPSSMNEPQASSQFLVPQGILPENHPGGEPDSASGNFISQKFQVAANSISSALDSKSAYWGPFAPPVTKIESAVQESEGFPSKALSVKDNILHNIVAGLFQPKPIVDTIEESEKYGNTGDKFYSAGQAIVGGASGVSNFVNTVLEVPGNIFKKITRAATEKLNNLGGRLIGL